MRWIGRMKNIKNRKIMQKTEENLKQFYSCIAMSINAGVF